MKQRTIVRVASSLGLAALIAAAVVPTASAECSAPPSRPGSGKLLYSYIEKSGNVPDTFSIAGVGNHAYLFGPTLMVVSPEALASKILQDKKGRDAKQILLTWPYSGSGEYSYARQLEEVIHKPAIGFAGPLWWYPDGTAISADPRRAKFSGPDQDTVADCVDSTGRYHPAKECKSILAAHDNSTAIFGNTRFVLDCDKVQELSQQAENGDARASMQLYFFDFFVNVDDKKAALELAKAAIGHVPLAEYLVAQSMKNQSPPRMELYSQFLHQAADDGSPDARQELGNSDKRGP